MNFIETILSNGFNRIIPDSEIKKGRYDCFFNTSNGWMGLTIYHPYERFEKDNKVIELSLEMYCVKDTIFSKDGIKENDVNERWVKVLIDNKVVYQNRYGVMPPMEIQKQLY